MNQQSDSTSADRRDEQRLRPGRLSTLAIAFFVISAAAPLTAMAGGAPFGMLLGNGAGVPFNYLIITALMVIFAVGYVAMARHHTSAGAFYSYVARALGGHAGGAAAWIALLGYNTMQIGLFGLFGVAASGFLAVAFGWNVPWWLMAYLALALIALLGFRQIDLSMRVLGVLVACEFLIMIAFNVMVLAKGGAGGGQPLEFSSFTFDTLRHGGPSLAQGLLFAAASFIGFEATTIYSEEAKDPSRTVPRATYIAVLVIGLFYTLTSWLMVNAHGNPAKLGEYLVSKDLNGDPTNFLFTISVPYVGEFLGVKVMLFLFASSLFAALLAFHNAVARYAYALGREGLVPEVLGRTHPQYLSPHMGSLSQSVLAAVVVAVFAIRGMDPAATLFTWLTQLGTLAITYLMALATIAVIAFFAKRRDLESNPWRTTIAPALATLGLGAVAVYSTMRFGFLINSKDSVLGWLLPALIPVAGVIGIISASVLRSREPRAFERMGRDRALQLHEPGLD